jgi:Phage-related minor tail protein/Transglycosylase SLT domain
VADDITLLLAIEARDKASAILNTVMGKLGGFGDAMKTASAQTVRSSEEIEAAQMRAAASVSSLERAQQGQALAQAKLRESMLASKAAQLEADAAVREGSLSAKAAAAGVAEAAGVEETALIKLQESERLVAARSKEMAAAQAAASTEVAASGAAMKGVAIGAGAVALAVGYIGEKSVSAAGDFQSSTTRLITSAGEINANIGTVRQGMLQMAGDVGYSTEQLSAGMYKVESGTFHGAAGLQVLRAAAEGAKTENADLKTVADAVTTTLIDYHLGADQAAMVTTKLVAATSAGKTSFEELSGSLHSVMPNASSAHIALSDILGDLAAMTVHGMSAQQAAENLNDVINHMKTPTSVQAKELALLGMTTNQLADDLKTKGLSGTLQEISDRIRKLSPPGTDKVILDLRTALNNLSPAVRELGMHLFDGTMSAKEYAKAAQALDPISAKQALSFATLAGQTHRIGDQQLSGAQVMQNYGQALAKATGDATGLNVALMLTGDNAGQANDAIKTVADATTEAGNHVKGWGDIQATFNYKLDALKGKLEATKIAIGTGLLPAVTAIATKVLAVVGPIAVWTTEHSKLSAIVLGSIGGVAALVATVIGLSKAIGFVVEAMKILRIVTIAEDGALIANPIGIVIALLVALGVAIYEAWQHSATFRKIVIETWDGIKVAALWTWNNALKPTYDGIVVAAKWVGQASMWLWHNALEPAFRGIAAVVTWAWENVIHPVLLGWELIFKNVIGPVVMWLYRNVIVPAWEGIQLAISVAWAVIKVIWDVIKVEIKGLGVIFGWLYDNAIRPAWERIRLAIEIAWTAIQIIWGLIRIDIKILAADFTWLYDHAIKPAWELASALVAWAWSKIQPYWEMFKAGLRVLGDLFTWFYESKIRPAWQAVTDAIAFAWSKIQPYWNDFKAGLRVLGDAFEAAVTAIGNAWDKLREKSRVPIAFVVNSVINPLIRGYNDIAGAFGVNKVSEIHGFAAGGQIPGAPSRTDNTLAMVATGEYIMPTDKTSRYLPLLEAMRSGNLPGFAGGGLVGLVTNPAGYFKDLVSGPLAGIAGRFGDNDFVRMLGNVGHHLLDGIIAKAKSLVAGLSGGGGAGPGELGQWIATAIALTGVPASWAGGLHTLIMRESGGNPKAINLTDSNAQAGHPSQGLMQTIPSTFSAYRLPGLSADITDPISNIVAGIRYILSRYGDISNVQQANPNLPPMGYAAGGIVSPVRTATFDSGGPLRPGYTLAYNGTGGDEWVSPGGGGKASVYIDLRESKFFSTRDMDDLIDQLDKRLVRVLLPAAGVHVRR